MININANINIVRNSGGGAQAFVPENEELADVITQATSDGVSLPPNAELQELDDLITAWKSSGFWDKAYIVFITMGDTSSFYRYDFKDASRTRTSHGSGAIVSSKGVKGSLAGSYYESFGWNPSIDDGGGLLAQNAISIVRAVTEHLSQSTNAYGARSDSGGVRQIAESPFSAINSRLRFIVNDATNSDFNPSNASSKGFAEISRTAAGTKRVYKDRSSSTFSVNSVGLPNAEMFLFARNNDGTADLFSDSTLGFWAVCSPLTLQEDHDTCKAWYDYYLSKQDPLIKVPLVEDSDSVITLQGDETSVFGFAEFGDYIFYSSSEDENLADVDGYSVRAYNRVTEEYVAGLIVDVSGFAGYTSIYPFSSWTDGTTIYFTCSVRPDDEFNNVDTVLFSAPISTPLVWSFVAEILTAGDDTRFNHGAYLFEDPAEPTKLKAIYTHRANDTVAMRINIAEALKTDLTNWTVTQEDVIDHTASHLATSQQSQVYPQISLINGEWYIIYGRFTCWNEGVTDAFTCFATKKATLPTAADKAEEGKEFLWPDQVNYGYTSVPRIVGDEIFFTTRAGGASTAYDDIRKFTSYTKQ